MRLGFPLDHVGGFYPGGGKPQFDPGSLSPVNWYAPDTIQKTGTDLVQWNDAGSLNYPLFPVIGHIPQIIQVNGLDVIQFADSTQYIDAGGANPNHLGFPDFTIILAFNYFINLTVNCFMFSKVNGASKLVTYKGHHGSNEYYLYYGGTSGSIEIFPSLSFGTNKSFLALTWDNTTKDWNIYRTNDVISGNNPALNNAGGLAGGKPYCLNAYYAGTVGGGFSINIYENIIYNQAFDASTIAQFKDYIKNKYAF